MMKYKILTVLDSEINVCIHYCESLVTCKNAIAKIFSSTEL